MYGGLDQGFGGGEQKRPEGVFRKDGQALEAVEQEKAGVMGDFGYLVEQSKLERPWKELRPVEQDLGA